MDDSTAGNTLITVIIPAYNISAYIERCVNSVISQDYKNLEIFIIDDGSTDNTGILCDRISACDKRIIVIHKDNGGLSSARNIAIDRATGEFIFFVDGDDYITPGVIRKLYLLAIDNKADIACCKYYSRKKNIKNEKEILYTSFEALKEMLIGKDMDSNAVCKLYKKYLFDNLRYPECAHEVVPVTYKLLMNSNRVVSSNIPGYVIEKRLGSITRSEFGKNNVLHIELTRKVYEHISSSYPQMKKYAYTYYLTSIIDERENIEIRCKDRKSYEAAKVMHLFDKKFIFFLIDKNLSLKKKIISILIKIKLYKIAYKVVS